ncbi:uncharacterized protein FPRO_05440 [Fusarium proliferatum ET1]|uniref:Antifungal protein n=1 Tax=Fusarium proliferatum (strain ET1) TaxID=1227346 RepID=A0A1L7VLH2_FUSPR|nr:uncharacterized protein FPRO_05440 [Fusarium proliferatum ET1]CZR40540.1 uncharacterized protein FPRO_05440 [Fusarium proliferatum ET1]
MQLLYVLTGLLAGASVAVASPASEPNTKLKTRQFNYGKCNGTSCKVALSNLRCQVGSCTRQSGAGDGKTCWIDDRDHKVHCPGRG